MPGMIQVRRPPDVPLEKTEQANGWVCIECEAMYTADSFDAIDEFMDCEVCPGECCCLPAFLYRCPVEGRECDDESHHFGMHIHVEET